MLRLEVGVFMNLGANTATNDYLLFMQANVVLPENFRSTIESTIANKTSLANFKLRFDWDHWFLKANASFCRFSWNSFQFGDQGLLIENSLFNRLGGYNNQVLLAEGNELLRRARKYTNFMKLDAFLVVSARKYKKHGVYKLQLYYIIIYVLIRFGLSKKTIMKIYLKLLKS